ncbi:DNA cytosine methyltransferase [Colwellia sp. MB3u-4]|uniref:DNA cytosine methyltransferase n=1 Tax=Colwellia sp. MB3u-4 TaxID=2759822 RepID=UPI0015F37F5C|nr:DNA cytosine methyltransferase [Colwellia sp. MB3u-4]MBA6289482.1 DNA cytosine methyltransferase [Colwellia sp. MB3u-4]
MVSTKNKITFNSFFAGIGGFDLALESEGFHSKFFCEKNDFCRQILTSHWPNHKYSDDITTIDLNEIPQADVWCGGFPCQDVSVARGNKGRDGLKGKNSGLFFPFAELIKEKKPKTLLIENVTGLLSSHNGQDFRIILETLSGMGYSVAWRVMNSRYFGAPQSRPRVFICAVLNNSNIALSSLYEKKKGSKPANQRKGFLTPYKCEESGATVAEVSYCLAATSGRHTGTDWSRTYVSYDAEVRRLTPLECEGLQGFPEGWTSITCPKSDKELDLDAQRYQALGNAVAVPVVKWIAKRLKKELEKNKVNSLKSEDKILSNFEDFKDSSRRHMKLSELHLPTNTDDSKLKWQTGGIVIGDECWDVKAPEAPSQPIHTKLIDVIQKDYPSDKYFISSNAAVGIIRRVVSQNRTLFGPMQKALENLIESKNVA